MTIESHLAQLNERHRRLESDLHLELQRPTQDTFRITELKKQKLRVKEEMERLRRED